MSSFFVPSDVSHQVHLTGADTVFMIWIDPEYQTERTLQHSGQIEYPLHNFETDLKPLFERILTCETAAQLRELLLGRTSKGVRELDERISTAIRWIKDNLAEQTISVEDVAGSVFLSPSRFMHLFSQQIGIPVRKFVLWQRLKITLLMLADGQSITKAAHAAGFTDSSHLNRTFNTMFGISPSEIFKNSRFIQVFAC